MVHFEADLNEGGQCRGLVIGPFEIFDPVFKETVVVESIADIQDEIILMVLSLEIIGDILNVVSV